MKELFDHEKHLRALEETAEWLRGRGKHDEANAVATARRIHLDMVGRMAEARRVTARIRRHVSFDESGALGTFLRNQVVTMERYVVQREGPWIGSDLYPSGWPDGKPSESDAKVVDS